MPAIRASQSPQHRRIALAALGAAMGAIVLPSVPPAIAQPSRDDLSYVMMSGDSESSMMSGSTDDLRQARALRTGREALLYVRQGSAAYVVRDAATLRRAEAIFAPQRALGTQQAELGSRQAALGSRQATLGAEQARLGGQQVSVSRDRALHLARQQSELSIRQNALGREQGLLGREQSALGREQARLGRIAREQLRALVAAAIRSGAAQRVG